MKRITKAPEERKSEILDAAEELFIEKGFNKTSVNEITRKVKVAHGLFYYYFKSKEDLLNSIIERYMEYYEAELRVISEDKALSALEKFERVFTKFLYHKKGKEKIMISFIKNKDLLIGEKLRREGLQKIVPHLTHIVKQGVKEGVFDTDYPKEAVEVYYISSTYFNETFTTNDPNDFKRTLNITIDVMERLFGAKKGTFSSMFGKMQKDMQEMIDTFQNAYEVEGIK
ncbi:MAG: TetR/AcrR family transcriptional regulator [Candidatus Methanofastidiosia archaeon]